MQMILDKDLKDNNEKKEKDKKALEKRAEV